MAHEGSLDDFSLSTLALHSDDYCDSFQDEAPPLRLSTSFKYSRNSAELVPIPDRSTNDPDDYYYSRISAPTTRRFETALSAILKAHAVTYASGLAAFHAALILLNPRRVSIGKDAYFGCQGVIDIVSRQSNIEKIALDCPAEGLHPGDLIMLETPLSPSGLALNIAAYAQKAHARGAFLLVSSTLAPPGLQDPFALGADLVMHSGSKYIGGHSDTMSGILATQNQLWANQLRKDRSILGNTLSGFDSWLGLRSIRTLDVRLQRQSESTQRIVVWLNSGVQGTADASAIIVRAVASIGHTSMQTRDMHWLEQQMPNGYGALFSLTMKSVQLARRLPSELRLFKHRTSFGGIESSVEWRRMSDVNVDERLLRFSIGLENWQDLKKDLLAGMTSLVESGDQSLVEAK
ncbi:cystathionine beta-lyase [Cladophialophora yegresii CBS 114405]|uniref:Cystathionine beta-lyase n=1 Tax=Cladophialophora yegresii CBS 114405 TaxID=1182544 RepID=W9W2Q3_9EURO|nr:cystathionine beta-lyase [Cladophialophora yegresii CBS 114405]EXJ59295.1 cystathionine beta-lyase [Cladophialophora yegresii CBS 114405]